MKAVITILFVLFTGLLAQAQDRGEQKVETIQMERVKLTEIKSAPAKTDGEVARLYRRNGSRVKKALEFATRNHRGMA